MARKRKPKIYSKLLYSMKKMPRYILETKHKESQQAFSDLCNHKVNPVSMRNSTIDLSKKSCPPVVMGRASIPAFKTKRKESCNHSRAEQPGVHR